MSSLQIEETVGAKTVTRTKSYINVDILFRVEHKDETPGRYGDG